MKFLIIYKVIYKLKIIHRGLMFIVWDYSILCFRFGIFSVLMDCCLSGHLFHVVFLAPYRRRGLVLGSVRHIKILSSLDFFGRPLIYWLDIWSVAISRWVTVQVRISFRLNDFWLSYGPWTFFFVQILSCPESFFTSFEILTWYLVCGYI
jgi:hypothetical protein